MRRGRFNRVGLSILFSLVVLVIFLITGLLVMLIGALAIHSGLMERFGLRTAFPVLLAVLAASAIIGTVVSLVVGRVPLRPLQELIDALNKLARGDFSARIAFGHTPEFRELRDSFNRMAAELGSIELLRRDFINNFSHEFKTPIVSIKGFAELLQAEDLPAAERAEYLDIIIRESTRLTALATNVLNLSKVENQVILTGQKPYELSEQIRRCILTLQTAWEHKGIQFELELEEARVHANEEMLSQVWLNLIDNAVKFSPQGGSIAVKLEAEGNRALVSVRDHGIGVDEKDLPHILEQYFKGETSRTMPGNGLGLTLCQRIVALHGGEIACVSQPGSWTEFTVRLPLA